MRSYSYLYQAIKETKKFSFTIKIYNHDFLFSISCKISNDNIHLHESRDVNVHQHHAIPYNKRILYF